MIGVNGVAQACLHHSKLCLLGSASNDLRSRQEASADKRAEAAAEEEEVQLHVYSIIFVFENISAKNGYVYFEVQTRETQKRNRAT